MKKTKRVLSLLLSVVMLLSVLAGLNITAFAASGTTGNISWDLNISTGVLTLTGKGATPDYTTTSYSSRTPWYNYRTNYIKSVVIGEGVTGIGNYAFTGCTKLTSVTYPSTLQNIGKYCFQGCTALTNVALPASIANIYNYAYSGCTKVDTVTFNGSGTPADELHIYPYAFYNCTGSTYWLDIPENTRYIDDQAFNNTNFNYVKILSDNVTMGTNSFGCTGYARFFSNHNVSFYNWIKLNRTNNKYSWYHYCLNDNHDYQNITVDATCIEQGYDLYYCPYCDADTSKTNFTAISGHKYHYLRTNGTNLIYSCEVCGKNNISLDCVGVYGSLLDQFSHEEKDEAHNQPYKQTNYTGSADIYLDGYVNAKDFLLLRNLVNSISLTNKATTIDESTTYQTMEGFGASACWWSQEVGGWDNIDTIMDLLYSKENGIGLNVYRYNLGGGSNGDTHIGDPLRRAECFLTSTSNINNASTYNWNADANAQAALASAQRANSDLKVTLFSNSAPVSLTTNGKAYCSNGSSSNLSSSNYSAFATYVVNCAQHFIDEGYNVTTVSPINEPEWGWAADASGNTSQEGCHFSDSDARNFYNGYMVPALKRSALNGKVDLSVWESGQLNHGSYWNSFINMLFSSDSTYSTYNANIRNYVDSLDTHSYWCSESDRTTVANQLKQSEFSAIKKVRCTEYCQMTNDGNSGVYDIIQDEGGNTNGMTIEYGIALADIMYQDITILNAVEWDWWTACSTGVYPDGLVYINLNDHDAIQTCKRLWCMGNYSKFIEDGATRVAVSTQSGIPSTVKQTAYVNPDGSIVVVYINKGTSNVYTSFNDASYKTFETYVTDASHDLDKYQSGQSVNGTAIAIPAQSVTTVVIHK